MTDESNQMEYYSFLAKYWDEIYGSVPYKTISEYIDNLRTQFDLDKSILDVACGTGLLLECFENMDYEITGADLNEKMKEMAEKRLDIPILKADYRYADYSGSYDIIVSLFNSFAYCTTNKELKLTLKHLSQFLKENGLLIFDLYTVDNVEEQFTTTNYTTEDKLITKTIWGREEDLSEDNYFKTTYIFNVIDQNTEEVKTVVKETTRGIFFHSDIISISQESGYRVVKTSDEIFHETFVLTPV